MSFTAIVTRFEPVEDDVLAGDADHSFGATLEGSGFAFQRGDSAWPR